MKTDPHLHLHDLYQHDPACFDKLQALGWLVNSSLYCQTELDFLLEKRRQGYRFGLTFGVHPQLPVYTWVDLLTQAAAAGHLSGIGECGWDFYDSRTEEEEKLQDELFVLQAELAIHHNLPVVIHLRRATDKVFQHLKLFKRLPAVVFHSWPAPPEEARSLLAKGVNAWFSLGTTLLQGKKSALRCVRDLPADRLLMETDAPWQTLKGRTFTALEDLPEIYRFSAELRGLGVEAWEAQVEGNFRQVFRLPEPQV